MTAKRKISRIRVAALCLSVGLLALIVVARHRGWWFAPLAHASLEELRREHARLAVHNDETLTRLRRELAALRANAPADPAALIATAGARFAPSFDPATNRLTLRVATTPPRWSEIVATVDRLGRHPGWHLVGIDLRSRGSRHRREISAAEIVLERVVATPGRPAVGPVSPGSSAPARPRNAGRSSPLRRTSASAGRLRRPPPAFGPDFAPFRARPSGLGRPGFHPSLNPQPNSLYP